MKPENPGYFKFWRKIFDHPLWEPNRERTRLEAWVFLVGKAKGSPDEKPVGYSNIPLKRGQLFFTIKCLAKNWKWSRGRVRRFLEYLVKEGMIEVNRGCIGADSKPYTQTDTPYSILTICNYDFYNPLRKQTDTQTDTQRTPSGHLADTNNKVKKGNKDIAGAKGSYQPQYPTVLTILHDIEGWPVDPEKDDGLIHRNKEKHDLTIDQLEQAALELATWYEDHLGEIEKSKSNPRSRFNTFTKNRAKWDAESGLSGGAASDGQPSDITVGRIRQEATSYLMRAARGEMDLEQFGAAILKRYDGQSIDPDAIKGAWELAQKEFGANDG